MAGAHLSGKAKDRGITLEEEEEEVSSLWAW